MAKGSIAKEKVKYLIKNALANDYIGEFDNKIYTWADDGNERVQISIALTCPKVYKGVEEETSNVLNFEDEPAAAGSTFTPADITQEEQETLAALMAKLNL